MFAIKDGERLYLKSWSYNVVLTLVELSRIVEAAGGRVKPAQKMALISNRTLALYQKECESKIQRLVEAERVHGKMERRIEEIDRLNSELKRMSSIDNSPIEAPGQSWIWFVSGGELFRLSFDDNPFLDHMYIRTPILQDDTYSTDAAFDAFDTRSLSDIMLSMYCSQNDRREAATLIYKTLRMSEESKIIPSGGRIRRSKLDF